MSFILLLWKRSKLAACHSTQFRSEFLQLSPAPLLFHLTSSFPGNGVCGGDKPRRVLSNASSMRRRSDCYNYLLSPYLPIDYYTQTLRTH